MQWATKRDRIIETAQVLFEDNHLLVLNKPAGWVVQGALAEHNNLLEWARLYIKRKYQKPGNVFLGVVSRIDSVVTGVLPYARTSKAAARLSEQFRDNQVDKRYVAIVENAPPSSAGKLEHWLLRQERDVVTRAVAPNTPHAQLAILEYQVLTSTPIGTEITIRLITGRKHQIRAQLQAIGCPIVGDKKYGAKRAFPSGIALHCQAIRFLHPTTREALRFQTAPPKYWRWQSEIPEVIE